MDSREPLPPPQQPPEHSNMMLAGAPPSYAPTTAHHPSMINPNLPPAGAGSLFNSMEVKPPGSSDGMNAAGGYDASSPPSSGTRFSVEPAKKKRGRPRKYTPDSNIALGLCPTPISSSGTSVGHAADSGGGTPGVASEPPVKRNRGRPPGSGKKQLDALGGVGGVGFTPHVITVKSGEDIASKIYAFSQQGPRTVCILSANGAIDNVTLRQPNAGGAVTYEGRFEILSLSGSFLLSEYNGNHSRSGGLSVSLAGSDGRVIGGGVAGVLKAAGPLQVIVGSFIADGKKSNSSAPKSVPSSAPSSQMLNFGTAMTTSSPPSQGGSSDSSDENGSSPINRGPAIYGNPNQPIHSMLMYQRLWAGQNPH